MTDQVHTFVCSLCGRTDHLDSQGLPTREEVAKRWQYTRTSDGRDVCRMCVTTPPSQSFDLHALDSALDQ